MFVVLQEDKCPSGCQLEGLIDAVDENVHKRLRKICEKIQQTEDIGSSLMRESVRFYGSQRKAVIQTYSRFNYFSLFLSALIKSHDLNKMVFLYFVCILQCKSSDMLSLLKDFREI